jgi:hypothetical protein
MRIIMNSAMVPNEGTFHYFSINADQAREWLSQHGRTAVSYVGYTQTAAHIESLAGVSVSINRAKCTMNVGDEALIVKLAYRVPDPETKGKPQPEEWEYGILRRVHGFYG